MGKQYVRLGGNIALNGNAFIKAGYEFDGWQGDDGNSYTDGETITSLTSDLTLTATWAQLDFTINFQRNGTGGGSMPSISGSGGTVVHLPTNTFTREGFQFLKWVGTDGNIYDDEADITLVRNVTLVAAWAKTYTITFNTGGGSGTMAAISTVSGASLTLPYNTFTRTGYVFTRWSGSNGGSYSDGDTITLYDDITLTAVWTARYTITFNSNGGVGTMQAITENEGTSVTLPANGFTRDGYSFVGWSDSNGRSYADRATFVLNENLTLRARWVINYTITFDANGGDGFMESITKASGSLIKLPPNTFTRTDFTFVRWQSSDGNIYYDEAYVILGADLTLSAEWHDGTIPTYTITFDAGGGTGSMASITTAEGTTVKLPANTFTRDGYAFSNWICSDGIIYLDEGEVILREDVILTAEWLETYTITFNAGGGSGSMAVVVGVVGVTIQLPANAFKRSGYSFKNWSGSDGKTYANRAFVALESDIFLTANWERNSGGSTSGSTGGSGGGGDGGPIKGLMQTTQITYIPTAKTISAVFDESQVKWNYNPTENKFRLMANINGVDILVSNGFYTVNSTKTVIINGIEIKEPISETFYFNASGDMIVGWLVTTLDSKTSFADTQKGMKEGTLAIGWKVVDGYWYFFDLQGTMLVNTTTPDGYLVGTDGKWVIQ